MPIYEYRCLECRKKFERIILSARAPAQECPKCRGTRVERLVSRFATAAKGGSDDFEGGPAGGFGGDDDAGDDFGGDEFRGDDSEGGDSGHHDQFDGGDGEDDD